MSFDEQMMSKDSYPSGYVRAKWRLLWLLSSKHLVRYGIGQIKFKVVCEYVFFALRYSVVKFFSFCLFLSDVQMMGWPPSVVDIALIELKVFFYK